MMHSPLSKEGILESNALCNMWVCVCVCVCVCYPVSVHVFST